jgi:hypothetical protein
MTRLLPVLVLAFKIWMAIDAVKRRAAGYWIWIILLLPFGDVVYFFAVKLDDFDLGRMGTKLWPKRPASVERLRLEHQRSPSLDNKLALGQGLYQAERYEEATTIFREALERERDNPDALFGLGVSCIGQGRYDEALEPLTRLIETDKGYQEFNAWPRLAHALFETGRQQEGLELLERLVRTSPRLSHSVVHAHYLLKAGRNAEARDVLELALAEHKDAPRFIKRQYRGWERQARRLLKQVSDPR